jgi:hypothetical protein
VPPDYKCLRIIRATNVSLYRRCPRYHDSVRCICVYFTQLFHASTRPRIALTKSALGSVLQLWWRCGRILVFARASIVTSQMKDGAITIAAPQSGNPKHALTCWGWLWCSRCSLVQVSVSAVLILVVPPSSSSSRRRRYLPPHIPYVLYDMYMYTKFSMHMHMHMLVYV